MSRLIAGLFAVALTVSACSGNQASDQATNATDTGEVSSNGTATAEPTPNDTEPSNSQEAASMSYEEAADWYAQAICKANTYGPVRTAAFDLAEDNQINVPVLRSVVEPFAQTVLDAQDDLRNPTAPWPSDVAELVAERAQLLDDSIDLIRQLSDVETPRDYLAWVDSVLAVNDEASFVVEDIRLLLDLPPSSTCPGREDPDVESALLALEESLTATISISCDGLGGDENREFSDLDSYFRVINQGDNPGYCTAFVYGFTPDTPTEQQREAMALYSSRYEDGLDDEDAFGILLDNCVTDPTDGFGDMTAAEAILIFCPETPYAETITQYAEGSRIENDGSYIVGEDITAGRWRSANSVSDCYWERARSNGETIANDFITFAAGRVTVNISPSDGSFTTEGCGSWEKVS